MTNGNDSTDQAARRAGGGLPLARIVAAMLGVSAAFFALAMPPRILGALIGLTGVSVTVGIAAQLVFAILFAALAAAAGWLALTLLAGNAAPAPIVVTPAAPRKRPIVAKPKDPAPTLRRGDAHPDAPPRRPIFAKDDLGTPFDEIVTDRRVVRGAPEAEFAAPDAPVDLDATIAPPESIAQEPAVAVSEPDAPVEQAPVVEAPVVEAPVAAEAPAPAEELQQAAPEPLEPAADETGEDGGSAPAPRMETRPAPPREDDSIAALMARFESGLGRLGGRTLPPPDAAALATFKRADRNPDDALRDALEALQQMAARQR